MAPGSNKMSLQRPNQKTFLFVHVRRELVETGNSLQVIVEDVNQIIQKRTAVILVNGQFLRQKISLNWNIDTYFSDETSTPYEHPPRRWDEAHRVYFMALWGIRNPYQYAEESGPYNQFCIGVAVPGAYLVEDEKILALVDAERDESHIYCPFPCYGAEVVYTSRHRLICMKCGHLHCVLARPLMQHFRMGLSGDEWYQLFDPTGELIDDSPPLEIVDYREVAKVESIWMTDAWLGATAEIKFYATATPEEINRYEAGLVGPDAWVEAGFAQIPMVPPPSAQIKENGFGIDIMENAATALKLGASAYVQSHKDPAALREAVLNLFQAVELILKIRLKRVDPTALRHPSNNPTVIDKLRALNVMIDNNDVAAITDLRRIRNKLQHSEASFSYRATRMLLRRILVFLDDFSLKELGYWMGDAVAPKAWGEILHLEQIRRNAVDLAAARIAGLDTELDDVVQGCPNCGRQTLVRARLGGSECMYCRHRPTLKDVCSNGPPSSTSSEE